MPHDDPRHNLHTERSRGLASRRTPCVGGERSPRGRLRVCLSPYTPTRSHLPVCCEPHDLRPESDRTTLKGAGPGSRSRWLHAATSYAPFELHPCPIPGAIMDLVVKARDPKDGATVMVTCPSGREALAMLEHLRQECLKIIGITDRQGAVVSESDLATDPWSLRLFRATGREGVRRG